ncbi:MAG: InlB B-repeat-containing protein [Bacilli bacterium]|nr:InlB B-repeat-containing protein [Bacilli bacterium]
MIRKHSRFILGFVSLAALASCGNAFKEVDVNTIRNLVSSYGEAPDFVDNYLSTNIWSSPTTGKSKEFSSVISELKKAYPKVSKAQITDEELPEYRLTLEGVDEMVNLNYKFYAEGREITCLRQGEKDTITVNEQDYELTVATSITYNNLGFATEVTHEYTVNVGEETAVHRNISTLTYSSTFTVNFDTGLSGDDLNVKNPFYANGYYQAIERNGLASKPGADPVRDGYTFKFWAEKKSDKEGFDFENTPITKSFTLYAIYEKNA